ncbi:hypothetical protein GCM10010293_39230 [Streptomyces griseoflavus]|nr:hypothetical protein GCM10010293_39230 [Streptomyces griseoflavus]
MPAPVAPRLVRGGTLPCGAADGDHEPPAPRGARPTDEAGRGLRVACTLARERGTSRTTAGRSVWCEVTAPPPSAGPGGTTVPLAGGRRRRNRCGAVPAGAGCGGTRHTVAR